MTFSTVERSFELVLCKTATGRLEAMNEHLRDTLHDFVAERFVILRGNEQVPTIQRYNLGTVQGPGLKMPGERRKEPGPSQRVARAECFDLERAVGGLMRLQAYPTILDQIKMARGLSLAQEHLSRLELGFTRPGGDDVEVLGRHASEDGVIRNLFPESFHV